mmetsp:Transcript_41763/g.68729  ORF Transcript_41763/g.68729 Transcript_41763/m.68729 type:complete len:249 (-) Transcript_41763:518-1264(-)
MLLVERHQLYFHIFFFFREIRNKFLVVLVELLENLALRLHIEHILAPVAQFALQLVVVLGERTAHAVRVHQRRALVLQLLHFGFETQHLLLHAQQVLESGRQTIDIVVLRRQSIDALVLRLEQVLAHLHHARQLLLHLLIEAYHLCMLRLVGSNFVHVHVQRLLLFLLQFFDLNVGNLKLDVELLILNLLHLKLLTQRVRIQLDRLLLLLVLQLFHARLRFIRTLLQRRHRRFRFIALFSQFVVLFRI